jgi:hypothetical protein
MDSVELIEELERLQNEFGRGKCQLPDFAEAQFWNDITRIEFDTVTQTYRFVSDN